MAGMAVASPLGSWIAAAASVSSSATCGQDRLARPCRRRLAAISSILRRSKIRSIASSFDPCVCDFRSSGVAELRRDGRISILFGFLKTVPNRTRRRIAHYPAASGQAMAVALEPTTELGEKKSKRMKQRKVVVTGMGVVSPLGHDPDVFYNNLLEGISGISEIETFDCSNYPT